MITVAPVPAPAQRTWRNSSRLRTSFSVQWNGCWVHFNGWEDIAAEVGDAQEFADEFGLPVTDERANELVATLPNRLVDRIEEMLETYRCDGEA